MHTVREPDIHVHCQSGPEVPAVIGPGLPVL